MDLPLRINLRFDKGNHGLPVVFTGTNQASDGLPVKKANANRIQGIYGL